MKISLVINGKETLFVVDTFEFSLNKYDERDLVLIFNETSFLEESVTDKQLKPTYVAEGVGIPTPTGYKSEKLPNELPLDLDGIAHLDTVRKRLGIIITEQVGKEPLILFEISTKPYTPEFLFEAIVDLAQLEYDKITNHTLIIDKPPVIVFDETQEHFSIKESVWMVREEGK